MASLKYLRPSLYAATSFLISIVMRIYRFHVKNRHLHGNINGAFVKEKGQEQDTMSGLFGCIC